MKRFFAALTLSVTLVMAVAAPSWLFVGSSVSAFTPESKPGLIAWWHAEHGITLDAGAVASWADRRGSGPTASVSGTNRPILAPNVQNGKPCVEFDGSNDYLDFGSTAYFTAGTPISIFFTVKVVAGTGTWYRTLLTLRSPIASRNLSLLFSNDANFGQFWWVYAGAGTGVASVGVDSADFTTTVTNGILSYNGGTVTDPTSWTAYRNGADMTEENNGGNGSHAISGNFIASWASSAGSFVFRQYICELGFYSSGVSAAEAADLAGYQSSEWAN